MLFLEQIMFARKDTYKVILVFRSCLLTWCVNVLGNCGCYLWW